MHHFFIATLFLALCSCGAAPSVTPAPPKPTHSASTESPATVVSRVRSAGPSLVLGWYCPEMAAGRPGIRPLLLKDPAWSLDRERLARAIGRRRVRQFSVLAWQGRRSGTFSVAGMARDARGSIAIGSYSGSPPCQAPSALGQSGADDPICIAQTQGCALAIGSLEAVGGFEARPYEEESDRQELAFSTACESDDVLLIDTDGDGRQERFAISSLQSPEPPIELPLALASTAQCQQSFAGPVMGSVDLVRMAVIDIDEDGRPEVLYRRDGGEFLLYGAPNNPARLELIARSHLPTAAPE